MPSIRQNIAIAANTTVVNALAGSKFEFLPVPSMVEVYAVTDALTLTCELTMGNVIEFDDMSVPLFPVASGGPNIQDHRLGGGIGAAGDRIVLKFACGATLQAQTRFLVIITPV